MQTSFTDKQLQDKDNKTSETIIRKCVHCGMCNATCPTYQVNGEELEGPRGRIYLIKDLIWIEYLEIYFRLCYRGQKYFC